MAFYGIPSVGYPIGYNYSPAMGMSEPDNAPYRSTYQDPNDVPLKVALCGLGALAVTAIAALALKGRGGNISGQLNSINGRMGNLERTVQGMGTAMEETAATAARTEAALHEAARNAAVGLNPAGLNLGGAAEVTATAAGAVSVETLAREAAVGVNPRNLGAAEEAAAGVVDDAAAGIARNGETLGNVADDAAGLKPAGENVKITEVTAEPGATGETKVNADDISSGETPIEAPGGEGKVENEVDDILGDLPEEDLSLFLDEAPTNQLDDAFRTEGEKLDQVYRAAIGQEDPKLRQGEILQDMEQEGILGEAPQPKTQQIIDGADVESIPITEENGGWPSIHTGKKPEPGFEPQGKDPGINLDPNKELSRPSGKPEGEHLAGGEKGTNSFDDLPGDLSLKFSEGDVRPGETHLLNRFNTVTLGLNEVKSTKNGRNIIEYIDAQRNCQIRAFQHQDGSLSVFKNPSKDMTNWGTQIDYRADGTVYASYGFKSDGTINYGSFLDTKGKEIARIKGDIFGQGAYLEESFLKPVIIENCNGPLKSIKEYNPATGRTTQKFYENGELKNTVDLPCADEPAFQPESNIPGGRPKTQEKEINPAVNHSEGSPSEPPKGSNLSEQSSNPLTRDGRLADKDFDALFNENFADGSTVDSLRRTITAYRAPDGKNSISYRSLDGKLQKIGIYDTKTGELNVHHGPGSNDKGLDIYTEFNKEGIRTNKMIYNTQDELQRVDRYNSENGKPLSIELANKGKVEFKYDNGKLSKAIYLDNAGNKVKEKAFFYDSKGESEGILRHKFNSDNKITDETFYRPDKSYSVTKNDWDTHTFTQTDYDISGRVQVTPGKLRENYD